MIMDRDKLIELFGLNRNFTEAELEQAYRDLVQVWHPDKYSYNSRLRHKAEEKLKEINNAYELLKELLAKSNTDSEGKVTSQRSEHSDVELHEVDTKGTKHTYRSRSSVISLENVFHPTDFSEASEIAFGHALKLAIIARTKLSILHVSTNRDDVHFSDFPQVRHTLERWGILPEGSSKEQVAEKTGLHVEKIVRVHENPVLSMLHFLEQNPTDLIVLATHQSNEPVRWLKKSVAETISRGSGEMTLFVPEGVKGFVSLRDGTVSLKRILIPIDHHPSPQLAVNAASALAHTLGCKDCLFVLVYVGNANEMPTVNIPTREGWQWQEITRHGEVVKEILHLVNEYSADLVVMTTRGHEGFLDALRGSTTERVLRGARCSLLAIPASRK
jgi:nucleotide-binding universal stress UspA family protein